MKKFWLALIFISVGVLCAHSAEKSILVRQPAYHRMSFYVFQPVNVPKEFYITYDGYLVYRDNKEVWHYASAEKNGITKTGYVVGSVIPSVVKLKPYNVNISSAAPVLGSTKADTPSESESPRMIYVPPSSGVEAASQYAPEWIHNDKFTAISRWQSTVDRMGIINRPAIPVAWKGDYPEVIYAWTGIQWRQLSAKSKNMSALSTIRRGLYDLTVYTNQMNRLHWTNEDTSLLEQYAKSWGYKWQGIIIPGKVY